MATFLVRVELHNATSGDYTKLHAEMEADGFSRTIKSDDGVEYHLPTAEYELKHASLTVSEVVDKAHAVAKTIKDKPAVIATKSAGQSWRGLTKV